MLFDFATVLAFVAAAVGFAAITLFMGSILRPRFANAEKDTIYECGERPFGAAWFNFNPRFYIVALVFVIFEVEVALTIPVALVFRRWVFDSMGLVAFFEIFAFILILFTGLIWIWIRKDLDWVKKLGSGKPEQAGAR